MISVRHLSLRLGEFSLRDICLDIREKEYFVVLGETGAGKTLLIESIAGLLRPQEGEVWVGGHNMTYLRPEDRRVGYLPQDYALFPHLTVKQNIAFGMKIAKRPAQAIAEKVAELAGLLRINHLLERDVIHLSGGERQRAALARALAIEPAVLLLDEPLSALDEQTRETLCGELRRVHEEFGTTTVHISHSFEETLALADRIAVVNAGKIEQVGAPTEVMSRPASRFVASFVRCQNILRGAAARSGQGLVVRVGELDFEAAEGPEGEVFLTIRPEAVGVALLPAENHPNLKEGRIALVVDRGALMRLDIDVGPATLVALIGRRAFSAGKFCAGDKVAVFFDPKAAHVFSADQL